MHAKFHQNWLAGFGEIGTGQTTHTQTFFIIWITQSLKITLKMSHLDFRAKKETTRLAVKNETLR